MRDITEEDVLKGLQTLREVAPPREATEAAMARAMETVRTHAGPAGLRSHRSRRWILSGSIAASLLAGIGLWGILSGREVSAAEMLKQVIQTGNAYRGWVHIVAEQNGALPKPISGVYPGLHINRADNTQVVVASEPVVQIEMEMPASGQNAKYDGSANEIRLGDMIPYNVGSISRHVQRTPVDLESTIALIREFTGRDPLSVTHRREGQQDRFDVQFFKDVADASDTLKPLSDLASLPVQTTLWVDPSTRLMQRATSTRVDRYKDGIRASGPMSYRIFYGEPALADIYAAGAPRDASVKDFRLAGDARALWERLEARHQAGFGDGAALCISSELNADGSVDPTGCSIDVYLRQGAARYYGDYFVSVKPSRSGRPRLAPFANWPDMPLEEVLAKAREVVPTDMMFVTDGTRAWGGSMELARWLDEKDMVWWDGELGYSVSSRVWPTRRSMWLYGTSNEFSMAADPERPGIIVVTARQFGPDGPGTHPRELYREQSYWLDPARDDMPIRRLLRDHQNDRQKLNPAPQREYDYEYTAHAQLANGQWYPARWRQTNRKVENGVLVPERAFDVRMRIYPGIAIDPAWFAMPPRHAKGQ